MSVRGAIEWSLNEEVTFMRGVSRTRRLERPGEKIGTAWARIERQRNLLTNPEGVDVILNTTMIHFMNDLCIKAGDIAIMPDGERREIIDVETCLAISSEDLYCMATV